MDRWTSLLAYYYSHNNIIYYYILDIIFMFTFFMDWCIGVSVLQLLLQNNFSFP